MPHTPDVQLPVTMIPITLSPELVSSFVLFAQKKHQLIITNKNIGVQNNAMVTELPLNVTGLRLETGRKGAIAWLPQ